jgi:hypothetical protein
MLVMAGLTRHPPPKSLIIIIQFLTYIMGWRVKLAMTAVF